MTDNVAAEALADWLDFRRDADAPDVLDGAPEAGEGTPLPTGPVDPAWSTPAPDTGDAPLPF